MGRKKLVVVVPDDSMDEEDESDRDFEEGFDSTGSLLQKQTHVLNWAIALSAKSPHTPKGLLGSDEVETPRMRRQASRRGQQQQQQQRMGRTRARDPTSRLRGRTYAPSPRQPKAEADGCDEESLEQRGRSRSRCRRGRMMHSHARHRRSAAPSPRPRRTGVKTPRASMHTPRTPRRSHIALNSFIFRMDEIKPSADRSNHGAEDVNHVVLHSPHGIYAVQVASPRGSTHSSFGAVSSSPRASKVNSFGCAKSPRRSVLRGATVKASDCKDEAITKTVTKTVSFR